MWIISSDYLFPGYHQAILRKSLDAFFIQGLTNHWKEIRMDTKSEIVLPLLMLLVGILPACNPLKVGFPWKKTWRLLPVRPGICQAAPAKSGQLFMQPLAERGWGLGASWSWYIGIYRASTRALDPHLLDQSLERLNKEVKRRYFSLETRRELTHPVVLLGNLGPLRLASIH